MGGRDVVILNTVRKQLTGGKHTTNFREGDSNQDSLSIKKADLQRYLLTASLHFQSVHNLEMCLPMYFLGIIWKFFNAFHIATNMITRKVSHTDYTNNESTDNNTGKRHHL